MGGDHKDNGTSRDELRELGEKAHAWEEITGQKGGRGGGEREHVELSVEPVNEEGALDPTFKQTK